MGLSLATKLGIGLGGLIALVLAVVGLVAAIGAHDKSVKQAGRDEVTAAWNAEKAGRASARAEVEHDIAGDVAARLDTLTGMIGGINGKAAQINVALPAAVRADPRYVDPRCMLTQPVLDQVNGARALSAAAK